ncbi:MAG: glutamine synthetase [candidate division Zixibacteria bacterium SM23_81]|nr:MAG: glutamine synthetase [candidate division Zixibacteria bacterium SM23_81]
MRSEHQKQVLDQIKTQNVRTVRLCFSDILGRLKGFAVPANRMEEALDEGLGFDGSSIEGFCRIFESDLLAMPDAATFRVLPWTTDGEKIGMMFCDVLTPEREPYPGDPRYVLKQNLEKAAQLGYTFYVGPELEYFYFQGDADPKVLDLGGYFDMAPLDVGTRLRKKTVFALERMGIPVEYSHHEVAPSQHEIDLVFQNALTMADYAMAYRLVVKEVARSEGMFASFMPKPLFGENGSGMHVHQSLFQGERNAFFDAQDAYHLSSVAKSYTAGILAHAAEVVVVTNQWVNSYKRLVPGYEAPAYISWGQKNRSALVRVPRYKPGKEQATRVELRCPDPACNPYLAFAVMLAAGLKGISESYQLPEPIEEDIYTMSPDERANRGILSLPDNLYAGILEAEKSELLRQALGEDIFHKFIANKKVEWDEYRAQVTDAEIKKYLPIL